MNRGGSISTLLLVLLLGSSAIGLARLDRIHEGINAVLSENRNPQARIMQTAESTVTNTDGIIITIKTPRKEDEAQADWQKRHLDAVKAFQDS